MTVFVEASVLDEAHLKNNPVFESIKAEVKTFRDGKDDLTDKVDFIVCLGGDGTLLYASSLFQVVRPTHHEQAPTIFLSIHVGKCPTGDGLSHGFAWISHSI